MIENNQIMTHKYLKDDVNDQEPKIKIIELEKDIFIWNIDVDYDDENMIKIESDDFIMFGLVWKLILC